MARIECRCGEILSDTDSPSPCSLDIYYESEVQAAIRNDPDTTLVDFLIDWDEKHECRREYMVRPEPVVYWYCPTCGRVYEFQAVRGRRWLRIFSRDQGTPQATPENLESWTRIYVMMDTETVAVMDADEDDKRTRLADYVRKYDSVRHWISPDESRACAIDKASGQVLYTYSLEDSWSPES